MLAAVCDWFALSNALTPFKGEKKQPTSQPCFHAEGLHELFIQKGSVTIACPAAQAFLSRLLLMLGSFVIMCLLLF